MTRLSLEWSCCAARDEDDGRQECLRAVPASTDRVAKAPASKRRARKALATVPARRWRTKQRVLRPHRRSLPRKLQDLLEVFFADDGAVRTVQALFEDFGKRTSRAASTSRRRWRPCTARRSSGRQGQALGELRQSVLGRAERAGRVRAAATGKRVQRQNCLQDTLTLAGFPRGALLPEAEGREAKAAKGRARTASQGPGTQERQGEDADQKAADHARKIYKLYTLESAMQQRLEKLPEQRALSSSTRRCTRTAASPTVGGADRRGRLSSQAPDLDFLGKSLEGRRCSARRPTSILARVGIQPYETAASWCSTKSRCGRSANAAKSSRPEVDQELVGRQRSVQQRACRFLRELQQSKVLFTAEGELFKASPSASPVRC